MRALVQCMVKVYQPATTKLGGLGPAEPASHSKRKSPASTPSLNAAHSSPEKDNSTPGFFESRMRYRPLDIATSTQAALPHRLLRRQRTCSFESVMCGSSVVVPLLDGKGTRPAEGRDEK